MFEQNNNKRPHIDIKCDECGDNDHYKRIICQKCGMTCCRECYKLIKSNIEYCKYCINFTQSSSIKDDQKWKQPFEMFHENGELLMNLDDEYPPGPKPGYTPPPDSGEYRSLGSFYNRYGERIPHFSQSTVDAREHRKFFVSEQQLLNYILVRYNDLLNDDELLKTGITIYCSKFPEKEECIKFDKRFENLYKINQKIHYFVIPGKSNDPRCIKICDETSMIQSEKLIHLFNHKGKTFVFFIRPRSNRDKEVVAQFPSVVCPIGSKFPIVDHFASLTNHRLDSKRLKKIASIVQQTDFCGSMIHNDQSIYSSDCKNDSSVFDPNGYRYKYDEMKQYFSIETPRNNDVQYYFAIPVENCCISSIDEVSRSSCSLHIQSEKEWITIPTECRFLLWRMFSTSESILKQTFIIDDDAPIFRRFDRCNPISSITFETFEPFVKNHPFVDYDSFVEHSMLFNHERQQICFRSKKTGQNVFSCDLPNFHKNVSDLINFSKTHQLSMFEIEIAPAPNRISAFFKKESPSVVLVNFDTFITIHPIMSQHFYLSINDLLNNN